MRQIFTITLALAVAAGCQKPPQPPEQISGENMEQQIEKNQMKVRWHTQNEKLFVTMSAPTTGWVALGLNDRPMLDGSLLVMGAVLDGVTIVEEHIAQPPKHPSRKSLGGRESLVHFEGEERAQQTRISFALDLSQQDSIAPPLAAGASVYLTLAFSQEDDFQHHSMMRTAVQITL